MSDYLKFLLLFLLNFLFLLVNCDFDDDNDNAENNDEVLQSSHYVFWPNATIPFYINSNHYDHEQSLAIMTSLSLFAFKTCLKFVPVMVPPKGNEHVMEFENPKGLRKCVVDIDGHSVDETHDIVLGYECLRSPDIDMAIMRALGFPFEHNRAIRDIYIDVQLENVQPSAIELYTKDHKLPLELRSLPYDINSVMHFGDRDNTKNGHRTIIFKNPSTLQYRNGLSPLDIRKIEMVYGPECRKRDRQEKIELCQNYPGVARKKREADPVDKPEPVDKKPEPVDKKPEPVDKIPEPVDKIPEPVDKIPEPVDKIPEPVDKQPEVVEKKSLRVNPDITPPPESNALTEKLNNLGIDDAVQEIIEQVYSVASVALKKVKEKHCNSTKSNLRTNDEVQRNHSDVLNVVESIARYAQSMVEKAEANLTVFCESSKSQEVYQRARCPFYDPSRCEKSFYKSTKSGPVKWSTNHRHPHRQSTNHRGLDKPAQHHHGRYQRSSNNQTVAEPLAKRKKRDLKSALRMATKIVLDRKGEFAPNYRAENQTGERRDSGNETVAKVTVPVTVTEVTVVEGDDTRDTTLDPSGTRRFFQGRRFGVKRSVQKSHDSEMSVEVRDSKEEQYLEEEKKRSKKKGRGGQKVRKLEGYTPKIVHLSKKNKEFYADRRWPGGVVYYLIQDTNQYDLTDMRRRLEEVNDILKEKTCARLQEIRKSESNKYEDYLFLDDSPDYVTGRVGGRQTFGVLELFKGGQHKQHAAMMVMAMLGFYFEVARHDRDDYIRVHLRHVRADKLHHFEKIRQDATLPLPYDYQSATHPAWQFWRHVGKTGISTVATFKEQDPDGAMMKALGQNEELLSETDLIKINSIYGIKCFANESQ